MNPIQNAAFDSEITLARELIAVGDLEAGFAHLERAHIIGQTFVAPHATAHWLMLRVEIRRRRAGAALGQIVRLLLGIVGSAIGLVPTGNSGGSDVSMFQRMPVAPELQKLIDGVQRDRNG